MTRPRIAQCVISGAFGMALNATLDVNYADWRFWLLMAMLIAYGIACDMDVRRA